MKITERDIEIMSWILEQRFMTVSQIRRVFWKEITVTSGEAHKRLKELETMGLLTTKKEDVYRNLVYRVSGKGVRHLKVFGRNQGLGEVDMGYTSFRHDLVETDIRIMFYELGFTQWLSERVLSKRNDLRRVPDGMIFNEGKYMAVEYESSQKSKYRYRRIFLDYELDRNVDKVLYITDTKELAQKVERQAAIYDKPYFVWLGDLKKDLTSARLKGLSGEHSFKELLNPEIAPQAVLN